MPLWNNLGFQDANSPLMEQLIFFHDHTMLVVTTIIVFIGYFMSTTLWNKLIHRTLLENQSIEVIWTCIPAIILIFIAIPSLKLLYMLDEVSSPEMTTKAIGHQWYWSYEYADFPKVNFDSYMIPSSELTDNSPRLLDTDNHIPLPMNMHHRILVTATDVIHSWTIPSLGVKADAVPGRLNQLSINLTRPGLFYGQCSEICGTNHSFMPIVLESLAAKDFIRMMA